MKEIKSGAFGGCTGLRSVTVGWTVPPEHDNYLNKDVLYDLAGLDINSINKSYKMLERRTL